MRSENLSSRPDGKIISVMPVMFSLETGNPLLLCHRELMTKSWCDKVSGDLGLMGMGRIEEGETPEQALRREISQESGLGPNDYVIDPDPFGYFYTEKGWVSVYGVFLDGGVRGKTIGPQDTETDCPTVLAYNQLLSRFGVRGGVEKVLNLVLSGKRGFRLNECVGAHVGEAGRASMNVFYLATKQGVEECLCVWQTTII